MVTTVTRAAPISDEDAALLNKIAAADGTFSKTEIIDTDEDDDLTGWADVPKLIGAGLVQMLPELAPVYSDDACKAWGQAADKVARKYGWDGGGLPPEASLLICTAMFVIPTVGAVKARKAAALEAKPDAAT